MKRSSKNARLDNLALEFFKKLEDKDAFIIKKIRACKEFKRFVKDLEFKTEPLFDVNDESIWNLISGDKVTEEPTLELH